MLPDRPAGMYEVAGGQCRSLSEDPRRCRSTGVLPSARRDPRATRPLETIFDEEVGDDTPTTHVLVLPMNPDLGSAPFAVPSQSGPPDEVGEEEGRSSGAASSMQPTPKDKPKLDDWRRRRSVSRVRYRRRTVRVARLSDPKAGFGRRRSPAPGKPQELKQSRKDSPPKIFTTRFAVKTRSASDFISRKARERQSVVCQKIKELLEASRPTSIPRPTAARAAARQLSPEREVSPSRVKEVAAAAVLEAVSSIASEADVAPDSHGVTIDEIYDWKCDLNDIPFWLKGPETFDWYIQNAVWDQTLSGGATGDVDPGWNRAAREPNEDELRDNDGRLRRYAEHNTKVGSGFGLLGINNGDFRRYLGLPLGGRAFSL